MSGFFELIEMEGMTGHYAVAAALSDETDKDKTKPWSKRS